MRLHKEELEPIEQFVIIYLAARNPEGGGTDLALAVIISSSVESYPLELSEKNNIDRLFFFSFLKNWFILKSYFF